MRIVLGVASLFVFNQSAVAGTTCQNTSLGRFCTTEVDFQRFVQTAYQTQQASQWCWAASISMIFAYYGHSVSQARIVSEVYGVPINMPAQAGIHMAQQLNKEWHDDLGKKFSARLTGAYDAYAGVYSVTNQQIVAELAAGRPLLYGNKSHAMVLTSVQYYDNPSGPNIVAAGVFDPWPGIGARGLSPAEIMAAHTGIGDMTFLATATITDVTTPSTSDDGGSGSSDFLSLSLLGLAAIYLRRRARLRSSKSRV